MMKKQAKTSTQDSWASPRELARYDAVRFLEEALRSGLPLKRALLCASERCWGDRRYQVSTLERWYYQYRRGGFDALRIHPREDKGATRTLSPQALEALLAMRKSHPKMHVSVLLGQLESQGVIPPGSVSLTTLYRVLKAQGLDALSMKSAGTSGPTKAFEFSWANQLWMSDGMWGPCVPLEVGKKPVRTHLLGLIDDCSRLCPHAQYYRAEKTEHFLDVLQHAVLSRGIPEKLYTDNGALFISEHLRIVCANLGIRLIHAKPYAAWSKGKIERFFLTVQQDFEPTLCFDPAIHIRALNERFWQWLEAQYHQRPHRGLDGQSPHQRFTERAKHLRLLQEDIDIERLFLKRCTRRVRRDATISLQSQRWEVPVSLIGRNVEIRFDPFTHRRVEIWLDGQKRGDATPLNKELNAHTFNRENYERHE